jgi:hypothetical protein
MSAAMGSPSSPLLEMMSNDQSPSYRLLLGQSSQVIIWGALSGCKGVSEHSVWSPLGSTKTLCALSFSHPENSWIAVKGSEELLFWKKVPPLVKSTPKDSQSPKTEGTRDRRARVAPVALKEGIVEACLKRLCIARMRKTVADVKQCDRGKQVGHSYMGFPQDPLWVSKSLYRVHVPG